MEAVAGVSCSLSLESSSSSSLLGLGVVIGVVVFARRGAKHVNMDRLPSYFKVGEKGGAMEGLLGGNAAGGGAQGKVD